MSIGPVEFLVISFPSNEFDGRIVPEISKLIESETVRIIDLVFITKDRDGNIVALEIEDLQGDEQAFASLDGEAGELLSDEDIALAAADLDPGSSAAFILWEDLWAAPLAEAIRGAGGIIVSGGRIPHDVLQHAIEHTASVG
jgi:uncharacterized membrane protein